jgi:phosphoribosylformylglycinamidine cyclo-ligase
MVEKMTYTGVGVDYEAMDPFKRLAQQAGRETANTILRLGFAEVEMSRGESAYLIDAGDHYVAHVEEGLGTKDLVADAMYRLTGKSYYDAIAQCTVLTFFTDNLLCKYEGVLSIGRVR